MASARMNEIVTQPATVPSHTAQWTKECALRCSEFLEGKYMSIGLKVQAATEYSPKETDEDHLCADVRVNGHRHE